jgi:tetratricopeptide (TPR) repeat protein
VRFIKLPVNDFRTDNNQRSPSSVAPNYFIGIPYARNESFIGGDKLLSSIFKTLSETKSLQSNHRVALYGLGGVGKTQTALEYAYKMKHYYSSVFWISGIDESTLLSGYQRIGSRTGCVAAPNNPLDLAHRALDWLQHQRNWLLVIDNLDDVSVIKGFLPSADGNGHTLITTRNPNTKGIPAKGLEVEVLKADDAVQLFIALSDIPEAESAVDIAEVEKIVKELGYLPLAIEQSASFIRETDTKIDDYLRLYQSSRQTRQRLNEWVPDGNRMYEDVVATTWKVSFDIIKSDKKSPASARLLHLFAFLNPDLILLEFVEAGADILDRELRCVIADRLELDNSLRLLQRFSLIKRSRDPRGITIHRLVQQMIQNELENVVWTAWWKTVTELCLKAFPNKTTDITRPACRKYQEQVVYPLSLSPEINTESFAKTLSRVAFFLFEDGKFDVSAVLQEKAVKVWTAVRGRNDPETLMATIHLAMTSRSQGRLDKAVALVEEALGTTELGDSHPTVLIAVAHLATSYLNKGLLMEAVKLQKTVVNISKATLGDKHHDTLSAICQLANSYWHQGRWDECLELQQTVLEDFMTVLGGRHRDTLVAMDNIAITYASLRRFDEAIALQERALNFHKEQFADDHPETLRMIGNLAHTYREKGLLDQAVELERTVLAGKKVVLGDRHPDTVTAMGNLAHTYWLQRRLKEAVVLEENIVEIKQAELGNKHPQTFTAMANLGNTYRDLKRWDEAIELQRAVVTFRELELGSQHYDTQSANADLAETYRCRELSTQALSLEETKLTAEDKISIPSVSWLSFVSKTVLIL